MQSLPEIKSLSGNTEGKRGDKPISRKLQAIQKGHTFHIWIIENVKKKNVWNEDNYDINKLLARLVVIDLFVRVSDSNGVQSINADTSGDLSDKTKKKVYKTNNVQ